MVFHLSLDLRDNISIYRTVTFLALENPPITQRNGKLYYALSLEINTAELRFGDSLVRNVSPRSFSAKLEFRRLAKILELSGKSN